MAFSLNRAQILGNLTRHPELRYTPNGQSVASFGVATNRRWKNQAGEMQEDTQFHEIVAWGKLAEVVSQILKKGNRVYVEGRLQTRTWDAPDGTKRQKTEIVMDNFVALTPKGAVEEELAQSAAQDVKPEDKEKPAQETTDVKLKQESKPKESKVKKEGAAEEDIDLDDLGEVPF